MAIIHNDIFEYYEHSKIGDLITIGEHLDIKRVYKVLGYNSNKLYVRKHRDKNPIWICDAKDFCRLEPIVVLSESDYKQIQKHCK